VLQPAPHPAHGLSQLATFAAANTAVKKAAGAAADGAKGESSLSGLLPLTRILATEMVAG